MRTRLCDLVGLELPIVQAPIGGATCPALVAAVSNAGALGMLAMTWRSLDEIARLIAETKQLTQKPFGVNLVLDVPHTDEPEAKIAACLEAGAKIVSFCWGDPAPWVERVHEAGALVFSTVASGQEAKHAVQIGVDVVVAQGWEAGGHVQSQVATLPLIPRVVDAVAPVPVVAAGGIFDGRGVAAALVLGAQGAWLGTRFLLAKEAAVHPRYQAELQAATESDTVLTTCFDRDWPGAPHRVLRTATASKFEESRQRVGEDEVIARWPDGAPIHRYEGIFPAPEMRGDLLAMALYAGQSVGGAREILPAAAIVEQLARETREALTSALRGWETETS